MKCEEILQALGDYVDGELAPRLCEELRQHLAGCNPCEIVVDTLRRTISVYKAGEEVELPESLRSKLHDLLRAKFEAEICGRKD